MRKVFVALLCIFTLAVQLPLHNLDARQADRSSEGQQAQPEQQEQLTEQSIKPPWHDEIKEVECTLQCVMLWIGMTCLKKGQASNPRCHILAAQHRILLMTALLACKFKFLNAFKSCSPLQDPTIDASVGGAH